MQHVVDDRRHLEHVLGSGVDERVVRIEIRFDDRVGPVLCQHCHDRLGALCGAAVDELSVVVVVQIHVLRFAESLQRAVAVLHLRVGDDAGDHEAEADECQNHS